MNKKKRKTAITPNTPDSIQIPPFVLYYSINTIIRFVACVNPFFSALHCARMLPPPFFHGSYRQARNQSQRRRADPSEPLAGERQEPRRSLCGPIPMQTGRRPVRKSIEEIHRSGHSCKYCQPLIYNFTIFKKSSGQI